jgi:hypothetical protein
MNQRREEVEKAHTTTFQWIFGDSQADSEDESGSQHLLTIESDSTQPKKTSFIARLREAVKRTHKKWNLNRSRTGTEDATGSRHLLASTSTQPENTGFVTWLREETGVFWIYGKPGAGKSTLMKCIMDDPRLEEHAKVWAGSHELSISSFYFWKLGSKIQKSTSGLYRALLWQMLNDDRTLIRRAFPGGQKSLSTAELGPKALRAALDRLMKACVQRKKHLILIDGLDEYEDDGYNASISQDRLCQELSQMVESGFVKIVIASRPDRVFESHFSRSRKLAVHDLTIDDIELFAHDRLINDKTIRPSDEDLSDQEFQQLRWLVRDIASKSQGVFLWTRVVVELLRVQIRDYHNINQLEETIEKLPPDLEELFDQIMERISSLERPEKTESLRYLAITSHWFAATARFECSLPDWLPVSILGVGCELRSHVVTQTWLENNTQRLVTIGQNESRIEGRAKSYCFGLLETVDVNVDVKVEGYPFQRFEPRTIRKGIRPLHRTLVEYILRHTTMQSAPSLSLTDLESFDANTAILVGLVVMQDLPLTSLGCGLISNLFQKVLVFNALAERSTGSAQFAILSAFDRVVRAAFEAFVGKHCHLDHHHKVNCVSRSSGFRDWQGHDKSCARTFEDLVQDLALNPSDPFSPKAEFLDLLALTIAANSNALLEHRMKIPSPCGSSSGAELSAEYATRLLRYALNKQCVLPGIALMPVSEVEGVNVPNFEALQLLLRLGGCPEMHVNGASAWGRFLDDALSQILNQETCIANHLWALRVLRILISHGISQSGYRIWAQRCWVRIKSSDDLSEPSGPLEREHQVIEYRRYSAAQVVGQIAGSLQADCEAELIPNHHASEVKALDKFKHYLQAQDNNAKCDWLDLRKRAHWVADRAMVIARRTGCDIAKYRQIQVPRICENDIVTWLPGGCCEMRGLLKNLDQTTGDPLTLQEEGPQVGFDVVGWLVFEERPHGSRSKAKIMQG